MYEALVARVRYHIQKANFMGLKEAESTLLLGETADAIEELQQTAEHYHGCMNEWFEAAQEYEAAVPKWIPVTERLPKEEKEIYWCYTNMGIMCECRWTNNRFGVGESDKWGWNIMDVPHFV